MFYSPKCLRRSGKNLRPQRYTGASMLTGSNIWSVETSAYPEGITDRMVKECGERDSNPWTPTRLDPKSSAFDLARQSPHVPNVANCPAPLERGFLAIIVHALRGLTWSSLWWVLIGLTDRLHSTVDITSQLLGPCNPITIIMRLIRLKIYSL